MLPCSIASPWRRSIMSDSTSKRCSMPREDLGGIGHRRRLVDLVGDERDLVGQPLDRLFRQVGARRDLVDALRQQFRRSITSPAGRSSTTSSICVASAEMRASIRSNGSGSRCGDCAATVEATMAREISSSRSSIRPNGVVAAAALLAR